MYPASSSFFYFSLGDVVDHPFPSLSKKKKQEDHPFPSPLKYRLTRGFCIG
jgi:hypothetical protein